MTDEKLQEIIEESGKDEDDEGHYPNFCSCTVHELAMELQQMRRFKKAVEEALSNAERFAAHRRYIRADILEIRDWIEDGAKS